MSWFMATGYKLVIFRVWNIFTSIPGVISISVQIEQNWSFKTISFFFLSTTGELVPGGTEILGIRLINFGASDSFNLDVSVTAQTGATPFAVSVTPTTVSLPSTTSNDGMVMIGADAGASAGESS